MPRRRPKGDGLAAPDSTMTDSARTGERDGAADGTGETTGPRRSRSGRKRKSGPRTTTPGKAAAGRKTASRRPSRQPRPCPRRPAVSGPGAADQQAFPVDDRHGRRVRCRGGLRRGRAVHPGQVRAHHQRPGDVYRRRPGAPSWAGSCATAYPGGLRSSSSSAAPLGWWRSSSRPRSRRSRHDGRVLTQQRAGHRGTAHGHLAAEGTDPVLAERGGNQRCPDWSGSDGVDPDAAVLQGLARE